MATVLVFLGKQLAGTIVSIGIKKALGVEVQGASIEAWGTQVVLGVFFGKGIVPGPTFEQEVAGKFQAIDAQLATINSKIDDLQSNVNQFKWGVSQRFLLSDEQAVWRHILSIKNSADAIDTRMGNLRNSTAPITQQQANVLALAHSLADNGTLAGHIKDISDFLLGSTVASVNTSVPGLLDIWREQALQEADFGTSGNSLASIYQLIQDKFTVALLIQAQCGRLLANALEALHQEDSSQPSAQQYYANTFYPQLAKEVEYFRRIVESLAVNLLPTPLFSTGDFPIPTDVAGILALADAFAVQVLSGRVSSQTPPPGKLKIPGVEALSGIWGRVLVPGTHWIQWKDGDTAPAQLVVTTQSTPPATYRYGGTIQVRAVKYTPETGPKGNTMNRGYVLSVGGDPRNMTSMLVVEFRPSDVIAPSLSGVVNVSLQNSAGTVLTQTVAEVSSIPIGDSSMGSVPIGFFASVFTGGMDVKAMR